MRARNLQILPEICKSCHAIEKQYTKSYHIFKEEYSMFLGMMAFFAKNDILTNLKCRLGRLTRRLGKLGWQLLKMTSNDNIMVLKS